MNQHSQAFKDRIVKENKCLDSWEGKYRKFFPERRLVTAGSRISGEDSPSSSSNRPSRPVTGLSSPNQDKVFSVAERKPSKPQIICPKVGAVQLRAKDLRKSWEEANEARMKNIARLSPENSQAFKSD
mmetsp:Transcript_15885/g.22238  ORF Transcript_15885/g.22238 Transcript_15885/m.22238 type:complete len:128 (+) Transcript_15885:10-393(+)|eukprot:CAMPEP_0184479976 /NCGR_PEP_ID=MMETSP0113_2-20130426/1483_1 /TAXON_ID=91329 /ORGANISM="Norrisiella sphaerica, Strain BC52" /LENGTH=127 /DNA_ID=CAMNT_0026858153 /DNA_START=118 /DNA_END=501 /DNA_ORIENTATION=+